MKHITQGHARDPCFGMRVMGNEPRRGFLISVRGQLARVEMKAPVNDLL